MWVSVFTQLCCERCSFFCVRGLPKASSHALDKTITIDMCVSAVGNLPGVGGVNVPGSFLLENYQDQLVDFWSSPS